MSWGLIAASRPAYAAPVYGYDDGGRLTSVTEDGTLSESYSYDANGNRVSSLNAAGAFAAGRICARRNCDGEREGVDGSAKHDCDVRGCGKDFCF